ncbi:MAG: hypothetical protein MJ169_02660 [Treponema sp.]|nr:hypothetical protein [Treponema sp.]
MKKQFICAITAALFTCSAVFAIKLPEGTNVRADNIKTAGDIIVEAELSRPATINTPLGQLPVQGTVTFYPSGKLKSIKLKTISESEEINASVTLKTSYGDILITSKSYTPVEFYESGALKSAAIARVEVDSEGNYLNSEGNYEYKETKIKTECLGEFNLYPGSTIEFYDSKDPAVFTLKTISLEENKRGSIKYNGENASFALNVDRYNNCVVTFYESGKLKSATPAEEYDVTTPVGDTFGKILKPISFYEDGKVASYYTDDVIQATVAGRKVSIPSGTHLSFYPNGNICNFKLSEDTVFTVGSQKYNVKKDSELIATEDGKSLIQLPNREKFYYKGYELSNQSGYDYSSTILGYFYANGNPKVSIKNETKYFYNPSLTAEYQEYYSEYEKMNAAYLRENKLELRDWGYSNNYTGKLYWLQPGDKTAALVYFNDKGAASSYSTYVYDGPYVVLDIRGNPVIDSTKKKFAKIEDTYK